MDGGVKREFLLLGWLDLSKENGEGNMCNSIIDQQLDYARPQSIKLTKEEWEKARERCRKTLSGLGIIYTMDGNDAFLKMIRNLPANLKPVFYL